MRKFRLLSGIMFLLLATVAISSCDNDDDNNVTIEQDIVAQLESDSDYSMLVAALEQADLVDFLSSDGPFTLFAPDNAAFVAFLNQLSGVNTIEDIPEATLAEVLTNHVLAGAFQSTDLSTGYVSTLNDSAAQEGAFVTMFVEVDGGVTVNGEVSVTNADIAATNGVIHQVDRVIGLPTVVTFATADSNFELLVQALTAAGLPTNFVETLSGEGPFTVFAPTNAAFEALLNSNPDWNSIAEVPKDLLDTILKYHVVAGANVRSTDLVTGQEVNTLAGETFTVQIASGNVILQAAQNTANVIFTDVQSENGVIHVIDTVILPE